jgi:hypothetical protein
MIGGTDLSRYLLNFNSSQWANQANQHLQDALGAGLNYSQANSQQAVNALQQYNNQAQNQLQQGYQQAQALNAPQHLATYNALDAYQRNLGLPTPVGGSFQLAQAMNNQASNTPVANPQQQQMVNGYRSGLLS